MNWFQFISNEQNIQAQINYLHSMLQYKILIISAVICCFLLILFTKNLYKILSILLFIITLSFAVSLFRISNIHHMMFKSEKTLNLTAIGRIENIEQSCNKASIVLRPCAIFFSKALKRLPNKAQQDGIDNYQGEGSFYYDNNLMNSHLKFIKNINIKSNKFDKILSYNAENRFYNQKNYLKYGSKYHSKNFKNHNLDRKIYKNNHKSHYKNYYKSRNKNGDNNHNNSRNKNHNNNGYNNRYKKSSYKNPYRNCQNTFPSSLKTFKKSSPTPVTYQIGDFIKTDILLIPGSKKFDHQEFSYNIYSYLKGISFYAALKKIEKYPKIQSATQNTTQTNIQNSTQNNIQNTIPTEIQANTQMQIDIQKNPSSNFSYQNVAKSLNTLPNHSPLMAIYASFQNYIQSIRNFINSKIDSLINAKNAPIVKALITGDKLSLTKEVRGDFANAGIAHLLAISGLHMCILGGIFLFIFRFILCRIRFFTTYCDIKKISSIATLVLLFFYLQVSSAAIPASRAFIMYAIVTFAIVCNKKAFSIRNVVFAALFIIFFSPEVIFFPGFHMSIIAVTAIISFCEKNKYFNKYLLFFMSNLFVSVVLSAITLYVFQQFSLYGPVVNLIAIPFMSFYLMPVIILFLVCIFFHLDVFVMKIFEFAQGTADIARLSDCTAHNNAINSQTVEIAAGAVDKFNKFDFVNIGKLVDFGVDFLFKLIEIIHELPYSYLVLTTPKKSTVFIFIGGFFVYALLVEKCSKIGICVMFLGFLMYVKQAIC